MKIYVPQPIPAVALERLRSLGEVTVFDHLDRLLPPGELRTAVADQHILFALGGIEYDAELIDGVADLGLIAAMHVSPAFVDITAATRRGIPVSGIPNTGLAKTTAEFTFALLMATAWRLPEADTFLRGGRWIQNQSEAFLGTRLYGKTLGIVGLGAIGTDVAVKARACDMNVVYYKRTPLSRAEEIALGAEYRSLEDLFRESDFVALTPPLTAQTKGLVGADLIGLMKPSAILLNTSRGQVLDEVALEDALVSGRIRGAGLDVFQWEGLPDPGPRDRLKELPNVV
ncbi:MAG: D-glycerate dehydrogenase, partial [Nitriliruptorales bacterium]|nr:D-glycerate dehydrogenase [Nitriliruptorales bacterium]